MSEDAAVSSRRFSMVYTPASTPVADDTGANMYFATWVILMFIRLRSYETLTVTAPAISPLLIPKDWIPRVVPDAQGTRPKLSHQPPKIFGLRHRIIAASYIVVERTENLTRC